MDRRNMAYFVTGGTGFIGRHVVALLTQQGEPIHVLVRAASRSRLDRIVRDCGERGRYIIPVEGDLDAEHLGVSTLMRSELRGRVRHFFHLAALYDLGAQAADLERANVGGTRHALDLAQELGADCFHLVSSIAVAGAYPGTFAESMFEEATALDHPYFRTKHEAEALVRARGELRWRIYRPGMVVGHSQSGAMDKIDGPYYFFKIIQKLRESLPHWLPLVGFEGGHINLVPVDFVAAALVHLAHVPAQDGNCFHLTDPQDRRIGEVLNIFAKAAHAPTMTLRLEPHLLEALPHVTRAASAMVKPLQRIIDRFLKELGVPRPVFGLLNHPTTFAGTNARALLEPAGIKVPPLDEYAWRLWDYWERHLDPDLLKSRDLRAAVEGRTVLITGGSSGIGRATALKLAAAGAHVVIVARDPEKLARVRAEVEASGGRVSTYSFDIADAESCQGFLTRLLAEHERIDFLINNAGRSIRRAIEHTYDRFHDYERLMRINYFAAVRVTLGVLPTMVRNGNGHVISISSIGVLSNAARFAGYNASKAALEAFTRCAGAEYAERGLRFTVVNMPLVRTPMVAPTRIYQQLRLIEPEQAADMICEAITRRSVRVATRLGLLAQAVEVLAPQLGRAVMSESFRMFPESEAAGGAAGSEVRASPEMLAFGSLMRGIHW